jgi:uncharacterized membrane protein YgcG
MKMIRRILTCIAVVAATSSVFPQQLSAATSAPSTINAISNRGTGVIEVTWSIVSGATSYQTRLLIGTVPVKVSPTILSNKPQKFTFVGLEYNVPYRVQVRSSDGTWSSYGNATENPVIPQAGKPSTPDQPTVSVTDDFKLKATWSPPSSSGGSPITSYSVQLLQGSTAAGEPVVVKGLEVELQTKDKTNQYSVTVVAVNEANVSSEASEASSPVAAEKRAAALVVSPRPPSNSPSSGGNNNSPSSGGSGSPSSGGSGSPTSGGSSTPSNNGGNNSPAASPTPVVDQTTRTVSPTPVTPRYTKVIKAKATTSSKTLLSLSKLPSPKGSKTTLSVAASSRKICQLKGTSVKNIRKGTCSVKVTVTTKSGKKTYRTVKLVTR